jgi:hypothetical protein
VTDQCATCPIRLNCDFLAGLCVLSARELILLRPDLIAPVEIPSPWQLYYERNRDKYRELNNAATRRYRQNDRERRLKIEQRYRERHRDEINARRRAKRKHRRCLNDIHET